MGSLSSRINSSKKFKQMDSIEIHNTNKGTLKYANGNVYNGDVQNGKADGNGCMKYVNGEIFNGEFKNDLPNGQGIIMTKSGHKYSGDFKDGHICGKMIVNYKNGDIFNGEFDEKGNKIRGLFLYVNGEKFEGEFASNGNRINGIYTFKNGNTYTGKYNDKGQIHGKGIHNHFGDVFKGDFKNGQIDGRGIMKYSNGDVYQGEMKCSNKSGAGNYTFKNGSQCVGFWKDNHPLHITWITQTKEEVIQVDEKKIKDVLSFGIIYWNRKSHIHGCSELFRFKNFSEVLEHLYLEIKKNPDIDGFAFYKIYNDVVSYDVDEFYNIVQHTDHKQLSFDTERSFSENPTSEFQTMIID